MIIQLSVLASQQSIFSENDIYLKYKIQNKKYLSDNIRLEKYFFSKMGL